MTDPSSGILFFICGLAVAGGFLFASTARPWAGGRAGTAVVAATAAATMVLLVGIIQLSDERLGDVRLSLRSIAFTFDRERGSDAVTIGGNRETDHVVIGGRTANEPRLAGGALHIRRERPDGAELFVTFRGATAEPWTGVVFTRAVADDWLTGLREWIAPSAWQPVGALDFDSSTTLCVPGPRGLDAVRLAADGRRLTLNGSEAFFELPDGAGVPAVVHDYAAVKPPRGEALLPSSRSVLLRQGDRWQLVILDAGAFAVRGDCRGGMNRLPVPPLALGPERTLAVSFRPLYPAEPWQVAAAWSEEDPKAPKSRLIERRSATMAVEERDDGALLLHIVFQTPESLRIAANDIEEGATRDFTLSLGGHDERAWGLDLAATRFRVTGGVLAREFVQRLELGSASAALIGNRVPTQVKEGEPFELGIRDRAKVALERLDFGWSRLAGAQWLGLAALLMSVAASWKWRRRSAYAFILVSVADYLLAVRLLAAVEAAVIDPSGPGTAQSVAAAVLALTVVPCVLLALAPAGDKAQVPGWQVWIHTALAALIIAHLLFFNQLRSTPLLLLGPAFVAASLVRLSTASGTAIAERARSSAMRLAGAVGAGGHALWAFAGKLSRSRRSEEEDVARDFRLAVAAMAVAAFALLIRIVMPERVLSFSTAIFYTPLWIAYGAFAFHSAAKAVSRQGLALYPLWLWAGWLILLALPLVWALLSPVGSDPGFAVVNAAALLFIILLLRLWVPAEAKRGKWLTALPAALVAMLFGAGLLLSSTLLRPEWPNASDSSAAAEEKRIELVRASLRADRWEDRLLGWFAPARLAESGTREAEELRVALQQMRQYGSQGAFGRGYINQPEPTELRLYQLNDNVSAVHLLAPFGRLGTAMFLIVIGVAAVGSVWRRVVRTARSPPTYAESLAYFSLWTLFIGSTYMVLANLQLVPFTGRNVYLLSASSTSDLIEGATLLSAALVGLHWRKAGT
jgi:hypothetical protein